MQEVSLGGLDKETKSLFSVLVLNFMIPPSERVTACSASRPGGRFVFFLYSAEILFLFRV